MLYSTHVRRIYELLKIPLLKTILIAGLSFIKKLLPYDLGGPPARISGEDKDSNFLKFSIKKSCNFFAVL